jgi:hypothetical protein
MKKLITAVLLAFQVVTTFAQALPHNYYVYRIVSLDRQVITLTHAKDEDNPSRVFVRMAQEDDVEFASDIVKLRTCFNRALGRLNDPMSALITLTVPRDPAAASAWGNVRARNGFGGMVKQTLTCDAPGLGPISMY